MARIIRTRRAPARRSDWWSAVIAGAAVGAVAAWVALRVTRSDEPTETEPARSRGAGQEPDLETMTARLRRVAGAQELRLRSLGGGILELVGSASEGLDVPALLHALASEPHVSVVVNRVWTPDPPEPARPRASDSDDSSASTPSAS
jgi:hypothetical protein